VKKDAVARLIGVLATAPAGPTSGGGKARVLCSSNLHAAGLRGWCYSRKATDGGCAAARARPPGIAGSCAVTRATGGVDQAPETPRKPIGSRSARSVGEVTSTAGTSFPEGGRGARPLTFGSGVRTETSATAPGGHLGGRRPVGTGM
jgi:hypothetical protein